MTRPNFWSRFALYLETPGDGGGGGGTSGAGGDGGGGGNNAAGDGGSNAAPTVYDVADDTPIRIKGAKEPVKFGEHVKGLQSQFTKASQRAAQLEREFAAYKQQIAQQQQQQRQPQQPNQSDPLLDKLAALPYITGQDSVEMVRNIADQIKQRDMVLLSALQQMKQMQAVVQSLNQNHASQSFDAKITKWVSDGGYPPEAADLAKEVYLAYEGDDLDTEFPTIFANRWQQLLKLTEAIRQQKINAGKRPPFVPGKGGQAAPSKPLEIKANTSSKQLADELFNMINQGEPT